MLSIQEFFAMGGYSFYVWSAYGSVIFFLFLSWWIPKRRWRNFLRDFKEYS